jgi:hypothetical protein
MLPSENSAYICITYKKTVLSAPDGKRITEGKTSAVLWICQCWRTLQTTAIKRWAKQKDSWRSFHIDLAYNFFLQGLYGSVFIFYRYLCLLCTQQAYIKQTHNDRQRLSPHVWFPKRLNEFQFIFSTVLGGEAHTISCQGNFISGGID